MEQITTHNSINNNNPPHHHLHHHNHHHHHNNNATATSSQGLYSRPAHLTPGDRRDLDPTSTFTSRFPPRFGLDPSHEVGYYDSGGGGGAGGGGGRGGGGGGLASPSGGSRRADPGPPFVFRQPAAISPTDHATTIFLDPAGGAGGAGGGGPGGGARAGGSGAEGGGAMNSYYPYDAGAAAEGELWGWDNASLLITTHNASRGAGGPDGAGGDDFNWVILLLAPLVVFGIAGNTLVILAISLERRLQNVTNYFLLSLAVTDLLVSLIVMPFSIINVFTGRWLFGLILCNLFVTADVLMCTSSILHLCTISLERYIGIRYPLWAKNKSKRTVFFKIVLVWTLALAITSPITVLGLVNEGNVLIDGQCLLANQHFIIYGSIFAFFIPLTIMVIMYALTVRMLNKQAKLCSAGAGKDGREAAGGPGGGGGVNGSSSAGGACKGGGSGDRRESQPIIRRSTSSRRHWQRQNRHTVLGAPTSTRNNSFGHHYNSLGRHKHLAATHSYPLGGGSSASASTSPSSSKGGGRGGRWFTPRYQALTKRNTLPLYHDRDRDSPPHLADSACQAELELCNGYGPPGAGKGEGSGGQDDGVGDTWPRGSSCPQRRQQGGGGGGGEAGEGGEDGGEEPMRLKELVRKHHVAVKAANILLMRKDLVRKETSSVQTEQKASKVLGVVFMIFVVCWAPFFLVNILTVLCPACYFSPTLFTVFVWLGYVSSTLNPIIYTVFNNVFKLTFLKLLCCRYGLLHRGRRRSHHHQHHQHHRLSSKALGLVARGARANAASTGLITCNSYSARSAGPSSSGGMEESMC